MNTRFLLGTLLALPAGLIGCAAPGNPSAQAPQATLATIRNTMREAAAADATRPPPPLPDAVARALLPPVRFEPAPLAPRPEPRFDLAVSNAPAQQVFLQIVTGTRYSMLVAPEVAGTVAVNLKNVTVREALDALRDLYGYEYTMTGGRIHIQPNTLQTRIFQVNYLAGKRHGTSSMRVTSSSIAGGGNPNNANGTNGNNGANGTINNGSINSGAGGVTNGGAQQNGTQSSVTSTESDNDFWGELRNALGAIVGSEGNRKVIVNPLSGVIAVRGFPADIRNAENYLRLTQVVIERQVMIEAKIIEVQLSDSYSSGINWAALRGANGRFSIGQVSPGTVLQPSGTIATGSTGVDADGNAANPMLSSLAGSNLVSSATNSGSIFGLAFQSANFVSLLQFLETQGNIQVLSSPRIATLNNQKAVLKVGTDEFFVTSISTSTTTSGSSTVSSPTINVQPFFSGIALDVTPQIDDAESIILHLHPSVSVVAEKQKNVNLGSLGSFQLPLAASTINESDSVVRVTDGHIVAIGGLMKQQQSSSNSGLPGAQDAAVVGTLFGQKNRSGSKSELVILLKPTIIKTDSQWHADVAETQQRLGDYEAPPVAATR